MRAESRVYVAIVLMLVVALAIDAATPLGVAEWVLYLVPVTMSLYTSRPSTPLVVAGVATLFIGVGIVLSAPVIGMGQTVAYLNRAMIIVSIWILAFVARQLIRTRLDLRERDWIRSGQRDLAERMQGELQLDELANNIIGFLCTYFKAPVGALYVAERGGILRRISAYAGDSGSAAAEREKIAPGEGLLGQAIRDKRILRLDSVPEGYLDVSSALGRTHPRHVVAVPAVADGAVVAAVELGLFDQVEPAEMQLFEAIGEPIAVAMRSSLYRTRLEELLEETQRQSEELQTQQEELKVANEELESQSETLRQSQARLEAQQAELEETNAQLEEQASAMEQQRDELARSQRGLLEHSVELARANSYKSEFLANMSHELRTPLNSALILARILADNKDGNLTAEQVKCATTIYTAGNDLLELINEILDLSRIEAGAMDLEPKSIEITQVVEPLARTFQPVAAQKNLRFDVDLEPGLPEAIISDRLRLQQILRNLLANAFKFTDTGGVRLQVAPNGEGRICFAIRDTGAGIPSDQRETIFQAFRQADGTTQRRHGGTGLGLTISRELAHRLGGEITVDSAPGEGSTFRLILPLRWDEQERREPEVVRAAPVREKAAAPRSVLAYPADSPTRSEPAVGDDREVLMAHEKSVLVIEDDISFATVLRDVAREQKFRCLVAVTAGEGIRLANEFRPSGVILDMQLPDASGLSVLEHLKGHPATRHIPIHVVSVSDFTQQALELGAVGYAIKPVRRDQLVNALKKLEQKVEQNLSRVLVVEDVDVQRESLVALLSADDVEIVSVATAEEALECLNKTTFDCMVLDLSLQGTSGYELLDKMAAGESFSFPPVIVYTGRSLTRAEEQDLRRYASSIVIKGARSPERLLDEVTLFLHQVEARLPQDKQRMLREARSRDAMLEQRIILLAEDDARNIFALATVLEPKGVTLRIARNGKEALAVLEQSLRDPDPAARVDLVLMDIMMPEMDGLTAMREIRRRPEWKRLPIIALTAKTMPDDREKCLEAGANDYIAKPLDIDKLVSLIRVWMPK